jgi:hypothetical protein
LASIGVIAALALTGLFLLSVTRRCAPSGADHERFRSPPDGRRPELAQAAARGSLNCITSRWSICADHRIVGAEALLRWRHPTLGLLPPGQFLPLAESSGLMPEIGAWVLGEACRQMHNWQCWHGDRSGWPSMCPRARWAGLRRRGKAACWPMPSCPPSIWKSS